MSRVAGMRRRIGLTVASIWFLGGLTEQCDYSHCKKYMVPPSKNGLSYLDMKSWLYWLVPSRSWAPPLCVEDGSKVNLLPPRNPLESRHKIDLKPLR